MSIVSNCFKNCNSFSYFKFIVQQKPSELYRNIFTENNYDCLDLPPNKSGAGAIEGLDNSFKIIP